MIIKSMARKSPSFHQLASYMDKGKKNHKPFEAYYNNLYSRESEGISAEFKTNAENLHHRKNGNYLYHEVISITINPEIDIDKQKEILYSLVNDYVQLRAKRNLVYGIMHTDKKDNLHYHLMISSNELGSQKRHRLKKADFSNIQKAVEKNVLNNFPELGQKIIYNQNKTEKTKNSEYELKRRTGKESHRDRVKRELTEVFAIAKNKADFFSLLQEKGYELYVKGNTVGVTWKETEKNYRLKTLGLLDEFNAISGMIEEMEHRKEEVKKNREESKQEERQAEKETGQERQDIFQEELQAEDRAESRAEETEKTHDSKNAEPLNEVQAEIERRKQELKKQRELEQEYSKDYDKGNDKSL